MRFDISGHTDVGRRRQQNEDSWGTDPANGLVVVADGMGGHAAGEVASSCAVAVIKRSVRATKHARPSLALAEAIGTAQGEILRWAQTDRSTRGMGTTVVAMLPSKRRNQVAIAHVGDSRIYLFRMGALMPLTKDHSIGQHALARALGSPDAQPDIREVRVQNGDVFLLCSDGLHGVVQDDAIRGALSTSKTTREAARRLVEMANELGGPDNITAVIVAVRIPG